MNHCHAVVILVRDNLLRTPSLESIRLETSSKGGRGGGIEFNMSRVLHFSILITNHHIGATTFTTHRVFLACTREDTNNFFLCLQSWTNVLTHLSKANAFYRRPSVISKNIFFVDSQPPSPPFQCCNTLRGHFHPVTTLNRGERVEMSTLKIEKLTRLTKQVFFGECLNYFCP